MDTLPHEKQIAEYEKTIESLRDQQVDQEILSSEDMEKLEKKLQKLKKKIYSKLTAWERVTICRCPKRPKALDYFKGICDSFVELHGDRQYADDQALVGGLAKIAGMRCVLIGNEKGHDTESRMKHNFGMPNPEGFRKALRLMRIAENYNIPVVSLVDTAGAFPGLSAEERGQAWAIAENLREMSRLKVPIIVVVIGEGGSGGALGTAVGDVIGMLEHAYYSVITPEGCASILWKDPSRNKQAAEALKMNVENLLEYGIVDEKITEPLGGAHHDPQMVFSAVKEFILRSFKELKQIHPEALIEQRYLKFRRMGKCLNISDN